MCNFSFPEKTIWQLFTTKTKNRRPANPLKTQIFLRITMSTGEVFDNVVILVTTASNPVMLAAVTAYVNQYEIDFQAAKARDAANAALKITDTQ